ncbi:MAG: Amino acid transporter substrate-binding protein [Hyphomicrobiales bacterium]|nr:Amino acid transporter substrate-binding protein [Hyphomicrobiales bacterium]
MCSSSLRLAALGCAMLASLSAQARELRVCADPNNLPFSNEAREGFENRIVDLVAQALRAEVTYEWRAQRRGFLRETLKAGACDLVPGLPSNMEGVGVTTPYYRSAYVFVTRADGPSVSSFDDPVLHKATVGVQLIGDDGWNTPPAHALTQRGVVNNIRGYTLYGDYRQPNPPARIVDAVANGEVDVAVVWGPLAGYFAALQKPPLRVTPFGGTQKASDLPMTWSISMAVRKADEPLRQEVEAALATWRREIDAVLAAYNVPRADVEAR